MECRKISNSMQRDVNYRRDTFDIINDNSTGMPETVEMLATLGKPVTAGTQETTEMQGTNSMTGTLATAGLMTTGI
jgi:hypothetical protein